jgi:hypothetical protein
MGRKRRHNGALAGGFPAAASVLRSIAWMDNSLTRRAFLRFVCILVVALTLGAGQALAESGSGSSGSGSSGSNSGSGSGSDSDNSGPGSGSDNSGPGSDNSGPGGGDGGDNSGPGGGDDGDNSGGRGGDDDDDDYHDHDRARDAVRDGRALPLGAFIARIERQYGGRLIDARLRERRGRLVYELKLMSDKGGRVFTVSVDAKTGRPRGLFGS